MEALQVEFFAKGGSRLVAQFEDLLLSDLVAQGLGWDRDVAVDFFLRFGSRERRVSEKEGHRLFTGPTEPVDSGIDDEPARAPGIEAERPEFLVRIGVQAKLGTE